MLNKKVTIAALCIWVAFILILNRFIEDLNLLGYIKSAEFFLLYVLIYLNFKNLKMCGLKLLLNCLYLSLFISVVDETVNQMVSGNMFEVNTVIYEISGSLIAFAIVYFITRYNNKKNSSC